MTATILDADPVVLEDLDIRPECIWAVPPCGAAATWWVRWSCGCLVFYCDQHVDVLTDVICDEHGPDGVAAVRVETGRI